MVEVCPKTSPQIRSLGIVGQTIGPYRVLARIGEGGMGVVYKAEDVRLERAVALKVLPPELAADGERLERFQREARAVAAINHPNIVTIYSVEEHDGVPLIAMELVEGEALEQRIPSTGLPLAELFRLAIPIAEALTAAHERHVTHRDLKPANIMIGAGGEVKVLDFGLARVGAAEPGEQQTATAALTEEGRVLGTVPYMSPEQVQGRPVDHRSDIFSLGVIIFEMATGRRPFGGDSSADLISSILRDAPGSVTELRPELPRHLGRIVRHCLEKDPVRRYQTALDVGNELRDLKREVDSGELEGPRAQLPRAAAAQRKAHLTKLVGRKQEMAELTRMLEAAAGGRGSLAMIGGEPGVGKTRLVEELIPAARERRFLTIVGHCYDTEGARPFSPWVEILEYSARVAHREVLRQILGEAAPEIAKLLPELRRIYPDIPEPIPLPPEQERHYLQGSFREYVERSSRVQPLLLALEDLQWADESTLFLLEHLAPHLSTMAVLVVGTYRDAELDAARPLSRALRQLVRERLAERIALKRLDRSGVETMLAALGGEDPPRSLVRALFETTEGNPFFVEEVFQHLGEEGNLLDGEGRWRRDLLIEDLEVPEGVRLVVGRRLERLGEAARKVLTAAALAGRRFNFEVLEALGDWEEEVLVEAIEEAERLQLVKPVPGRELRFDFNQELVRQTLASGLSSLRRQRLHLRLAEAMERVFAGDLDNRASALAYHLYEAGAAADAEKTIAYLDLAGRQALRAAAASEALRLFDEALPLVEPEDEARRADLLFRRGWTLRSLARHEEAEQDWLAALELYEGLGNRGAAARTCIGAMGQILWSNRYREAAELGRRGLALLGEERSKGRARLLAATATAIAQGGDLAAAEPMMREAFADAEELRVGPRIQGEMLLSKAFMHYAFLQLDDCIEAGRRGAELLRGLDEHVVVSNLSVTASALAATGRCAEADELVASLEPAANRLGHAGALYLAAGELARKAVMQRGDFAAYAEQAKRMLGHLGATGTPVTVALLMRGAADFWQGRWGECLERLAEAAALERDKVAGTYLDGRAWSQLLVVTATVGEREQALAMLDQPGATPPPAGEPMHSGQSARLLAMVEALALLAENERAAALYETVRALLATGLALRGSTGLVETVAGIAAGCGAHWDQAEEHFARARRQAEELPHVLEQAEVRCFWARMLLARGGDGDRERAGELLAEAMAIYERLGMPRHLQMARDLAAGS